jgi:EAL domain-containing protein (putative c-di-GMP-specific phosphodiesterase class I)
MRALNFDYFQGYYLGMPEPLNIWVEHDRFSEQNWAIGVDGRD